MKKSLFNAKSAKIVVFAAAATLAFGRMGVLHAASTIHQAAPTGAATLVALDTSCADDTLNAGDEVSVEGEDLALEEDADGLFITVEGETYSAVSFEADCETVNFQQIDGVDTLSGNDVDDEEDAEAADADDMDDEDMEEADADDMDDEDMDAAAADMDDMDDDAEAADEGGDDMEE